MVEWERETERRKKKIRERGKNEFKINFLFNLI